MKQRELELDVLICALDDYAAKALSWQREAERSLEYQQRMSLPGRPKDERIPKSVRAENVLQKRIASHAATVELAHKLARRYEDEANGRRPEQEPELPDVAQTKAEFDELKRVGFPASLASLE